MSETESFSSTDIELTETTTEQTDLSSSVTSKEMHDIQNQILSQSQNIERFISKNKSKSNKSEAFLLLESLFSLFKSEAKMNNSLRAAFIEERRQRIDAQQKTADIEDFFKEFSRITCTPCDSFENVYDFVIEKSKRYVNSKKQLKGNLSEYQAYINKLENQIALRDSDISNLTKQNQGLENQISKLKQKLNSANDQITSLEYDINEVNHKYSTLQSAFQEHKQTLTCEQSTNREMIAKYQEEIHQVQKQSITKITKLEGTLAKNADTIKRLNQDLSDVTEQLQASEIQISSLQSKIEYLQSEAEDLNGKNQEIQSEKQKIIAKNHEICQHAHDLECQLAKAQDQFEILKDKMQEKHNKYMARIKSMKAQNKIKLDNLSEEISSSLISKIQNAEAQVQEKSNEITTIQSQLKLADSTIESLQNQLTQAGKKKKKYSQVAEDLKIENERLRNIMREQTSSAKVTENVLTEFRHLQDLLDLDPNTSPHQVVEAVSASIFSRKKRK